MIPPQVQYTPGVDVVVVNYRTPDDLRRFVDSFIEVQHEVMNARLTIVDVDPLPEHVNLSDELTDLVQPSMWIVSHENCGYARACNLAAYELLEIDPMSTIAFFNADTELRSGVLDQCHWDLHQNKGVAVVGPKQVNNAGQITHAGIVGTNDKPQLRGWKQPGNGRYETYEDDCVSVSGSAYFMKRSVWDELALCSAFQDAHLEVFGTIAIGAMPAMRHYHEETFVSYHARHHGYKVAYEGRVEMIHEHQGACQDRQQLGQWAAETKEQFRRMCDVLGIERN